MRNDNALVDLLTQTDVRLRSRNRGDCPKCGGRRTISFTDECFYCHKCTWGGNAITLARELGHAISKPTQAELGARRVIRREAEQFADWVRRKRIATAALLRDLDRHEADWREIGRAQLVSGKPVDERAWGMLQLAVAWQERAESAWRKLFEFEQNAADLYAQFVSQRSAA